VRVDRSQSDPVVAARNAVGVAAPLVVGALAGTAALGLATTVGALQVAFADRPGPYRLRVLRMLGTSLAAATTATLAVLASNNTSGSVALVAVCAFLAGLLLAGGPSAAQTGTAGTVAALVLGHTPQPPSVAMHVGLLVLAGGAIQTVLAVAAWPLGRHRPERLALASLYRELAGIARSPRGTRTGPPGGDSLSAVRTALYGLGHDHGPSVEAYRVLLDEAERIRREIVVLGAGAERLAAEGADDLAARIRSGLSAAAAVLEQLSVSLERGRTPAEGVGDVAQATIRGAVEELVAGADRTDRPTRRAAAARLRALAGQLRAAVESTRAGASEGGRGEEPHRPGIPRLRDPIAAALANLRPDSSLLRHAVRLALLVGASDLVVRLAGFGRGYWVPLTILVILRPDFGTTLQRGVLRMAGTVVGLLLATALVHWVPGGQWWQIALIFVFCFGARLAGPANFGLSAVSLSALVVVLLEVSGVAAHTTLVDRAVATVVGGAIAMVAVLAFPTWERQLLPQRLVTLLRAYREYLAVVVDPDAGRDRLQRARAACRAARTNAQASLDRANAEPVPAQRTIDLGRAVLTHTHRFIHSALAMDAARLPLREAGAKDGLPELQEFFAAAEDALGAIERAVETGSAPQQRARLRQLQEQLAEVVTGHPDRAGGAETAALVVDATDRMTDSLDTLLAELRRQFGRARDPQPVS
jgi:uncharacterized membrane protein YccC